MSNENILLEEFISKDNLFNLVFFIAIAFVGSIIGEYLRTINKKGRESTLTYTIGNIFFGTLIGTIASYSYGDYIIAKYGVKILFGFIALCGFLSINVANALIQLDFKKIITQKLGGNQAAEVKENNEKDSNK